MTIQEICALPSVAEKLVAGEFDWHTDCPACGGGGALRIWQRADGSVGLNCLEGCGYGQICRALGVKPEELGGDGVETERVNEGGEKKRIRKPINIVHCYDYKNARGEIVYQVCVCADGTSRMRVPDFGSPHKWKWGRSRWGVAALPYRLPEMIAAVKEGRTVWVVPSERDADAMAQLGLVATCALGDHDKKDGAWKPEFCRWLEGSRKTVVIVARKDPAPKPHDYKAAMRAYQGQRAGEHARQMMCAAGLRCACVVLPDRAGVRIAGPADWVTAGGTKNELQAAVKNAPPWSCPDALDALTADEMERGAAAEQAALGKAAAASSPLSPLPAGLSFVPPHGASPSSPASEMPTNVGGVLSDDDARSIAALRGAFVAILSNKELEGRQKQELMECACVDWLCRRGRLFFHAEIKTHSTSLFFDAVDKRLSYIGRDFFRSWLALAMKINAESAAFRYIVSHVSSVAMAGGSRTAGIVPERYWARRGNRVYLSCGNGRMVRCSPAGCDVVDVGTDLVIFEGDGECQPWALQDGPGEDPFEGCEVFRTMNAIHPRGRVLLKLWAMSIMGHGDKTKPILLLTGKGRSGKTRLARSIMQLYGIPDKAQMISKEYKATDFWTYADAGGVMCLDNADNFVDWLSSCLCTVATGGSYSKKMNYKDNELITQKARCWCCVTGTTPHFAAESTVVDRLLTVELYSREAGDTKESSLTDDIQARRAAGLTWICRAWCAALADEACPPAAVNARHPDWGETAYRLARAAGFDEAAVESMTESEAGKALFSLRQDSLGAFIVEAFGETGFEGSMTDMWEALKTRCEGFDGDKWSKPKMGKAVGERMLDNMVKAFGMTKKDHSGTNWYVLKAIQKETQPPSMWGVHGVSAQSAHVGDRAGALVPSPPTSPTSKDLSGEDNWDL